MKKLKIDNKTKIYIVAPSGVASGGPELLHQLGYHLISDLHLNAFIYYFPSDSKSPVHSNFKKYSVPYVTSIEDNSNNIIIVPEIYSNLQILKSYNKIQKCIWWLSVDFFYITKFKNNHPLKFFVIKCINYINQKLNIFKLMDIPSYCLSYYKNYDLKKEPLLQNICLHFVQSHYASENLKSNNIHNFKFLSDYLNDDFLNTLTDISKKENIIVYNPKKGIEFTKKIISAAPHLRFIPIKNLTRQKVIKLLQRAKVYIDFGNHPGKDRIPREAAILKCCIITGKRGSARYYRDIPIYSEFKFEDKDNSIYKIVKKIERIFSDFETEIHKFEFYVDKIKQEKMEFLKDLESIFK